MHKLKLFMVLLGCTPAGRFTEQHDIFFGIAETLSDLVTEIINCWPEAKGKIHIDAWRQVNQVNEFQVSIVPQQATKTASVEKGSKLFFINLGGYKQDAFDEFHYKMLVVAGNKGAAIREAKQTAFYKHTGFKGASPHIDDKYGVDVDDLYEIDEILPGATKEKYHLEITAAMQAEPDQIHLGYFRLENL